jgi:succinate-acetate transporter protein
MSNSMTESDNAAKEFNQLHNIRSVTISNDMFEKLYLNPQNKVSGDLRKTFANPTPLYVVNPDSNASHHDATNHTNHCYCSPLLGFLIASAPLACALMGWRGAGGGGAATIGTYYFFGGMLQIIGAFLEWIIGNTFVYVVFGAFGKNFIKPFFRKGQASDSRRRHTNTPATGSFWLAFAITLTPFYNAEGAFIADATTAAEKAAGVASFHASLGTFQLCSTSSWFFPC